MYGVGVTAEQWDVFDLEVAEEGLEEILTSFFREGGDFFRRRLIEFRTTVTMTMSISMSMIHRMMRVWLTISIQMGIMLVDTEVIIVGLDGPDERWR